ncbi:MAG: lamin tail domain-containing protein [Bacteroidota bacterium]
MKVFKRNFFLPVLCAFLRNIAFVFLPLFSFAQLTDNFSDGDFTANPAWIGKTDSFTIDNGMLRSNGLQVSSTIYLSTATTLIDSVEWNFLMRLDFNPSSTNLVKVYLASDQSDLSASLNGYYVQFGETGNTDSLDIFLQNGLTSTKVFTGANAIMTSTTTNSVRIKIVRYTGGNWQVFADATGGTNFTAEGTFTDTSVTATSWFGVVCKYATGSRYNQYYFDDFSIAQLIADTIRPTVTNVNVLSNTTIDVKFSETVELASAQTLSNYSVNNGIGNPLSAARDGSDLTLVHLTFSNVFANATNYTLSISGVTDEAANVMNASVHPFSIFVASKYDVLINELMADPDPVVGLPALEFVELYNTTAFPISLNGWKFSDASTTVTIPNVTILPDSFVILCANANVDSFTTFGVTAGISSLPSLNNTSDNLILKDNNGSVIHTVNYLDDWYNDAVKADGGWTLELINPLNPCKRLGNWIASYDTNGGTPGRRNSVYSLSSTSTLSLVSLTILSSSQFELHFSENLDKASAENVANYSVNNGVGNPSSAVVDTTDPAKVTLTFPTSLDSNLIHTLTANVINCAGSSISNQNTAIIAIPKPGNKYDVVINEIFSDPDPSVGLPALEFVELFNSTAFPITLNGWKFSDASATATLPNVIILPDSFLILCANANIDSFTAFGKTVGLSSLPSLNNTSDNVTLKDDLNNVIHYVNYIDDWYNDITKADGGWTLELINPENPCKNNGNWIASTDARGGTPGRRNSVYSINSGSTLSLVGLTILNTSQIEVYFSESLDKTSAESPSNYSLNNGGGSPAFATLDSADDTRVTLSFPVPLDSNIIYTLTANVNNCVGTSISLNNTAQIAIPRNAVEFDVLINEIFPDPTPVVSLPEAEFVELFNRSGKVIDLKSWNLSKTSSGGAVLPAYLLLPDSFVILTSSTTVADFAAFSNVIAVTSFPALTNTGDQLLLKDNSGKLIHRIAYTDDWYHNEAKKDGGWTLELMDANNTCNGIENWRASIDASGGTPGKVNSVIANNPDTILPQLNRAALEDSNTLLLYFNELLALGSASVISSYVVNNGFGSPILATPIAPDYETVRLEFANNFSVGVLYTIKVSNLSDCSGNPIGMSDSARFAIPDSILQNDIVINEVLFNPRTGGYDFVELYNRSNKIVDLSQLNLLEMDITDPLTVLDEVVISSQSYVMFPQEFVVLSEDIENIKLNYYVANPDVLLEVSSLPNFPDDGICVLQTSNSVTIDSLSFSSKWHFALLDADDGVSLERIDYNKPTQDKINWHSAASTVGFATPTYQNSQYSETGISDDEINIDPAVFTPDNDGEKDFTYINYKFSEPGYMMNAKVYDARGREIRELIKSELLSSEGRFQWDGIDDDNQKARIGIYIIYVEIFNLQGRIKRFKKQVVLGAKLN